MNIVADPDAMAEGEPRESRNDGALWHHAAFCQLALPMQATDTALWLRETETASVAIAATGDADGTTQPAGKFLRLLLIHLFTRAVQDKSASIELGESASALASAMQIDADDATIQELTEQCARLAAARITVTLDSAAPLSVFDARGRPRANAAEWRPSLRLNSRFLEQLTQNAVRLDRSVMAALAGNLPALDAYTWVAGAMPAPGEGGTQASWDELCVRFGEPGMSPEEHRARFETCLQLVSAAWPLVRLIMGEEGVGVRRSEREAPRPRPEAIAPVPVPVAAPIPRPGASRAAAAAAPSCRARAASAAAAARAGTAASGRPTRADIRTVGFPQSAR